MQSITIFGYIHANLPALEAVLPDVEARGLSPFYCLGDLVSYRTFPNDSALNVPVAPMAKAASGSATRGSVATAVITNTRPAVIKNSIPNN